MQQQTLESFDISQMTKQFSCYKSTFTHFLEKTVIRFLDHYIKSSNPAPDVNILV